MKLLLLMVTLHLSTVIFRQSFFCDNGIICIVDWLYPVESAIDEGGQRSRTVSWVLISEWLGFRHHKKKEDNK